MREEEPKSKPEKAKALSGVTTRHKNKSCSKAATSHKKHTLHTLALPFALKSILRQKKKNYGKLKKDFECQV
jgi:hypothetical protein